MPSGGHSGGARGHSGGARGLECTGGEERGRK